MAAFNGKWSMFDVQGGVAYYTAIKSPAEYTEKLKKVHEVAKADPNAYIEEIVLDKAAGTIQRIVYLSGAKVRDSGVAKLGVELDAKSTDGRPAKVKIELESDTKLVRYENGDGFSIVTTFEIAGDVLTLTANGNGATLVSKLKRV